MTSLGGVLMSSRAACVLTSLGGTPVGTVVWEQQAAMRQLKSLALLSARLKWIPLSRSVFWRVATVQSEIFEENWLAVDLGGAWWRIERLRVETPLSERTWGAGVILAGEGVG